MQNDRKSTIKNVIPLKYYKQYKNQAKKYIHILANFISKMKIPANIVTLTGFAIGMFAINSLSYGHYLYALLFILINRFFDILDGEVARISKPTKFGMFLDYFLDYIFYAGVIFGFALAKMDENAIYASFLLFAFLSNCAGNFIYASINKENHLEKENKKPFYFKASFQAGDIFIAIIISCLFPNYFPIIASIAGIISLVKTLSIFSIAFYNLVILENKK